MQTGGDATAGLDWTGCFGLVPPCLVLTPRHGLGRAITYMYQAPVDSASSAL